MTLAPYRPVKHHGGYVPRSMRYPCAAIRPTRSAAGMTFTASRGGGNSTFGVPDAPAYLLRAFGTCDTLRHGLSKVAVKADCPCCGTKRSGKMQLTATGRRRLLALRLRRDERLRQDDLAARFNDAPRNATLTALQQRMQAGSH